MKEKKIGHTIVRLLQGDIQTCEVDAIVNAGNGSGGSHSFATASPLPPQASSVVAFFKKPPLGNDSPLLGELTVTEGCNLKSRYILHTALTDKKNRLNATMIRRTMQSILEYALEYHLESLAIPAIGTGIGGFPFEKCADILLHELAEVAQQEDNPLKKVIFVFQNQKGYKIFEQALTKL